MFGRYLVDNIVMNSKDKGERSSVILSAKNGDINYLHKTYQEIEVEL